MKIIWLSRYRTVSISTRYGLLVIASLFAVASLMGFMGGIAFNHTKWANASETKTDEPTPEQKMQSLTKILAELQAKVITMESLQQRPTNSFAPSAQTGALTAPMGATEGRGGRFISAPINATDISDELQKKSLDELLDSGSASLKQAHLLENAIYRQDFRQLQKWSSTLFYPSMAPVHDGRLASTFGFRLDPFNYFRAMHEGLDFAAPVGTSIFAAGAGVVSKVRNGGDYGLHLVIDHDNGYSTFYAHTSNVLVEAGEWVQKGQLIAKVGNTGRSTGPHLHFEIHHLGKAINPESVLNLSSFTRPTP